MWPEHPDVAECVVKNMQMKHLYSSHYFSLFSQVSSPRCVMSGQSKAAQSPWKASGSLNDCVVQSLPAVAQVLRWPQQGVLPSSSEAVIPETPPGQLSATYLYRGYRRGLSSVPTAPAHAPAGRPALESDALLVVKQKRDKVI